MCVYGVNRESVQRKFLNDRNGGFDEQYVADGERLWAKRGSIWLSVGQSVVSERYLNGRHDMREATKAERRPYSVSDFLLEALWIHERLSGWLKR